ncbi:MAG: hypothetical protein IJ368_07970 [Oscillospiraceae bacterium]|nr:hypothetical protein [Oscillospiraceae bacterium]
MIHKNLNNRRMVKARKIKRKEYILKNVFHDNTPIVRGKLDKGKVHCSCGMCSTKSTKMNGRTCRSYSYNSDKWYKTSERRKMNACDVQLIIGFEN